MKKFDFWEPVTVSATPSEFRAAAGASYWDSRARFYEERSATSQRYATEIAEFHKKIDADLEGYWTARRAVTGDDLAVRLEMAGNLIQKLSARIDELEENQYDPYDR